MERKHGELAWAEGLRLKTARLDEGCMRQASRMYQLTSAALALTTVLVFFAALYDMHQAHSGSGFEVDRISGLQFT